jgi:cell shape-determining protein MreC
VIPPKTLIGVSLCLLALSAGLGVLNTQKTRGLRAEAIQTEAARKAAEQLRIARENEWKGREAAVAAANARVGETQTKVVNTEAELTKTQKERNDLQAKLRDNETETAQLRKRIDEAEGKPAVEINPSNVSTSDLQAQLEDTKRELDAAKREKTLHSERIKASPEGPAPMEAEKTRRPPAGGNPGIRGTVLAVNRAYNFVVLNLGGRQGVEPNSEMLVLRGGSFIGRIRISSVEPATAIGDIITSSLARGVQVQPGDTVIYAGTNS